MNHTKLRFDLKKISTYLKTVNARHVSVTAYQDRSIRCSNSAALNWPKNIFLISLPIRITMTSDLIETQNNFLNFTSLISNKPRCYSVQLEYYFFF